MSKKLLYKLFTLVAVISFVLTACGGAATPATEEPMAEEEPMADPTIVDVAANTEGFSTLVAAVEAAGLTVELPYHLHSTG